MKIALFTEVYLSQTSAVETEVKILARGLERLGHKVLIVTSDPETAQCRRDGNVLFCPATPSGSIYGQRSKRVKPAVLNPLIDEFGPDVIHVLTFCVIGGLGLKYALARDLPLITTIHNLKDIHDGFEGGKARRLLSRAYCRNVFRKALTFSDVVTSSSKKISRDIRQLGVDCKILPIPLCIDTDLFRPSDENEAAKDAMRERLKIKNKTGILFVGKLNTDNRVETLLENWAGTISTTDRLKLVMVGSGSELESLRAKAHLYGISSEVTFAGEIPHEEIQLCYSVCSAFVSASVSTAMKASPLEAIACGLPVILPRESGAAELITEGVNGFTYDSPAKMGELLKKLASLEPEKEALIKNLVSRTAVNMTVENQTKAFVENYVLTQKQHDKRVQELE